MLDARKPLPNIELPTHGAGINVVGNAYSAMGEAGQWRIPMFYSHIANRDDAGLDPGDVA